jgi:hypothetical protein
MQLATVGGVGAISVVSAKDRVFFIMPARIGAQRLPESVQAAREKARHEGSVPKPDVSEVDPTRRRSLDAIQGARFSAAPESKNRIRRHHH